MRSMKPNVDTPDSLCRDIDVLVWSGYAYEYSHVTTFHSMSEVRLKAGIHYLANSVEVSQCRLKADIPYFET